MDSPLFLHGQACFFGSKVLKINLIRKQAGRVVAQTGRFYSSRHCECGQFSVMNGRWAVGGVIISAILGIKYQ
jgi:hypothetical protein